jgi:hypothetical protein
LQRIIPIVKGGDIMKYEKPQLAPLVPALAAIQGDEKDDTALPDVNHQPLFSMTAYQADE